MLVSILIPTRARPELLQRCISSIHRNALSRHYEVLLYVDADDFATIQSRQVEVAPGKTKFAKDAITIVGPRPPNGYGGLYKVINQLCEVAQGRLLWLLNDDAEIHTRNWDIALSGAYGAARACYPDEIFSLMVDAGYKSYQENIFPIITRQVYEAIGAFSKTPQNDSWVDWTVGVVRPRFHVHILAQHLTPELGVRLADETFIEAQKAAKVFGYGGFFQPENLKVIDKAREDLTLAMAFHEPQADLPPTGYEISYFHPVYPQEGAVQL